MKPPERFAIEPGVSDHFSWLRTRLAIESTYLAWMRTGISLIGFGFTIVQFFQRLQDGNAGDNLHHLNINMPRNLGLALIATGIGSLGISTIQYRGQLRYLWSPQFSAIAGVDPRGAHRTPAFFSVMVLLFIGVATFAAVFFRIT